jgi:hypothetical protein
MAIGSGDLLHLLPIEDSHDPRFAPTTVLAVCGTP